MPFPAGWGNWVYMPRIIGLLLCWLAAPAASNAAAQIDVWPLDALVKPFPDDIPRPPGPALAEVARGEHATLQIVMRGEKTITQLHTRVSRLTSIPGNEFLNAQPPRFVANVLVDRPTQRPSKDQLRLPPAEYPDPLLDDEFRDVPGGHGQAIWITVPVPTNAAAGSYEGKLTLTGSADGQPFQVDQMLRLTVRNAIAGPASLWVTEWFAMHSRHMQIAPEPESAAYYALLRRYARNMAEHRHNVALISPLALAQFSVNREGKLTSDFTRFDRWVRIFQEEGVIGRIEGGHIGGRKAGWESPFVVTIWAVQDGKAVSSQVAPESREAEGFYGEFLPALVLHLKAQGWLSNYLQHLADEPIVQNIESYRAMAGLVRKYAPELRTIEACHTKDLVGSIDVWVPQLNYLQQDFEHYQGRQKAGEEVWFYTCVFPQGEYANRFLEQPLIKTRLLHWINFQYGVTGYLHWGYNQWTDDSPFTHSTRPHNGPPYLPAGDPWIVYPGRDGPLDSIRFEAMRDGIADYALLQALAQRDPEAARTLARRVVLSFDRYNTDVAAFRAARHELLDRLEPK